MEKAERRPPMSGEAERDIRLVISTGRGHGNIQNLGYAAMQPLSATSATLCNSITLSIPQDY